MEQRKRLEERDRSLHELAQHSSTKMIKISLKHTLIVSSSSCSSWDCVKTLSLSFFCKIRTHSCSSLHAIASNAKSLGPNNDHSAQHQTLGVLLQKPNFTFSNYAPTHAHASLSHILSISHTIFTHSLLTFLELHLLYYKCVL